MLTCFVCKNDVAGCVKELYEHLKQNHGIYEQYDKYICCQGQCSRTFSNKYSYGRHVEKQHADDISVERNNSCLSSNSAVSDHSLRSCEQVMDYDDCSTLESTSERTSNSEHIDVTKLAAHFICEARGQISTLSSIQSVITACQNMFEVIIDDIATDVKCLIQMPNVESAKWNDVLGKLNKYRNPFSGLQSDYSQTAYLEKIGVYVKPETYIVGMKQVFVTDSVTGFRKPARESVTAQYIPISNSIYALNSNTDIVAKAIAKPVTCDGRYESFFDGSRWRSWDLQTEDVLVLRLYGDDFEPANPLGSRKTLYKLGTIYYQFENLPSHILSKTENMYMALCYHSDDVKQFGWLSVLQPLVSELQSLEESGLELEINGSRRIYKVVISAITGDNLFLNGILGFVESFTATHPCRQCSLARCDFQTAFVEVTEQVRSKETYDAAVTNVCVVETGIKQACVFNKLKYFHAADNYVQDIMHDMFEGVLAYDIPLIGSALVHKQYITLSQLNQRLQSFAYDGGDKSNKPPVITSLSVEMLSFDASQMWCLVRILSLAIGDLIPEDDDVWLLYISLRHILDLLIAPVVTEAELQLLSVLISEYLELRAINFPNEHLKNKHHHLTHYPGLIRKVGPLNRFSCMRFESKHQRCKRLLHISGNFKNVAKTCAVRHQHYIAFSMLKQSWVKSPGDLQVGNGSVVTLSQLTNGSQIDSCLGHIGMNFEVYSAEWIEFRGTKYKPGMCLAGEINQDFGMPVFMIVEHIFVRDQGSRVWLCGHKLDTLHYSSHYNCWVASTENATQQQLISWPVERLLYHLPVTVRRMIGNEDGKETLLCGLRHRI